MKISFHIISFLILSIFTFGCKKNDLGPADFYFQAKIDNVAIKFEAYANGPVGGGYISTAGESKIDNGTLYVERQGMIFTKSLTSNNSVGISIIKRFSSNLPPTSNDKENMFKIGTYSYGVNSDDVNKVVDGVVIQYIDNNGKSWFTDAGTKDQTGSFFEIVQHLNNTIDPDDTYSKKITSAQFSCRLYDNSGNSIVLTNGLLRARSVKY